MTVSLSGVTISGGNVGLGSNGGGVANYGTASVSYSTFINNSADYGIGNEPAEEDGRVVEDDAHGEPLFLHWQLCR